MQFGVSESVSFWGQYRPSSVAIYSDQRIVTYREFNYLINSVCSEIDERFPRSKIIAIAVTDKLEFLVSLIAALRLCKPVVLLNTGLSDESLKTNITDTKADILLHDDNNKRIASLFDTPELINITGFYSNNHTMVRNYLPKKEARPLDLWGILFSSGSTGTPKGIERSQESMVTEFLGWCLELNLNRNTVFYIGRPAFYTGSIVLTMATFIVNGSVILNNYSDDLNYKEIWVDYQKSLSSIETNWSFFIPDQLRVFIKEVRSGNKKVRNAASILTMGGPITGNEKLEVNRVMNSKIIESWGNSESLGTITDPEDLEIRPNSIGRPFLTDELIIVDETGKKLDQSGSIGKIAGSEEAGFDKYSNRVDETNRVKREHLIISDDIGYTDESGFFYILGRIQDQIIRNGISIYLSKIEAKIRELDHVKECCVLDKQIEESDFQLIGFLVCENSLIYGRSLEEIKQTINDQLSVEEYLDELKLVDYILKVPTGKIDKPSMRKKYLS